ncbi:UPF0702 transmembrane protein [Fibrisoma limi BUZ 3]|uniref:UPF0702 transmembrane protein n=1 Tax=Fibrisoma limi BUZ 3 TaxID=1185876 RepID=I2GG76_9BACT|nr:YetF domain-containing protein [Fibrisoma limi]CCH52901.1 UPF0702 transmembrane protein [Fibrisoma limi BUZ 3]
MKKENIHLVDWQRILFGEAPPEFMLEVFIRSVVIYMAFVVTARYLGKRMNGQLTITELAVMLTLGAIISPAMQLPERGILQSILALFCTLLFQRGLGLLGFKYRKVEQTIFGKEAALVKDGILQLDQMAAARISRQQVDAVLRSNGIYNVGQVKRLYLEAYGLFTIYQKEQDEPGLSTLPKSDRAVTSILESVDEEIVCNNCGNAVPAAKKDEVCTVCGQKVWEKAVVNRGSNIQA